MSKKYVCIKQEDIKDCGACCLLSIIKYYGGNIPIEKLKEMTKTTRLGTTAFNITLAAKEMNFTTKGMKCNIKDIKSSILPCIAHVVIDNKYKHYVVIYKVDHKKKTLIIGDPNKGIEKYSFNEFERIWSKVIILFFPNNKIPVINPKASLSKFLFNLIKPYKKILLNIIILSFLYMVFNIIISFHFKFIVDNVLVNNSKSNLYIISFIMFTLIIFKIISNYCRNNLLIYVNEKIDFYIIRDCFRHIISLPYSYFKNKTTGEIVTRINDLGNIREMISRATITVFIDTVLVIGVFIIFFTINEYLALISFIIFLCFVLIFILFKNTIKNKVINIREKEAEVNSYLVESIEAMETIKGLGKENEVSVNMEEKHITYLKNVFKFLKTSNIQFFLKELTTYLGTFIILFVGTMLVLDGKMTLGQLITFNALLMYFLEPIRNIIDLESIIREAIVSINRIRNLYEIDSETLASNYKNTDNIIKGNIIFNGLSFSYNNYDIVLNNINFSIKSGEKILITGKSGSGKSTLLKLLMNYYNIETDKIIIDGKDINDYNLKQYRDNICFISQNERLFTDSIYNNITFNRLVDYDKFLTITSLTKVKDFIKKDKLGYDFLIEENGFNISGGQKQRIVLARGILKNANIILLDEALSEIDGNLERTILKNLFKYYDDKTILLVSHRLENRDLFDHLITIKDGLICYE
ncbi:MAG: peptidase domain-containing ABC transporter [Bacilli bacterium]